MALNAFRWAYAAIIGCLVLSIVVLDPDSKFTPEPGIERRNLSARADRYYAQAREAATRARLLDLRDSIRLVTSRGPVKPGLRVFRDASLPVQLVPVAEWLVRRGTRRLTDASEMPIDLVMLYDAGTSVEGVEIESTWPFDNRYLLPTAAGERCTVIASIIDTKHPALRRQLPGQLRTEINAERLLGPCAYYGAFGMPGPHIARWLDERAFAFAREGSWERPSIPLDPSRGWYGWYGRSYWPTPLLAAMSPVAVQCALGNVDSCESIVLAPRRGGARFVWAGNILRGAPRRMPSYRSARSPSGLGPREEALLADMVRSLGREKFAAFWRSADPVPVAFQTASGESLSAWTSRWAGDAYIQDPTTPRMPGWTAVASVLLVALGGLIAVRVNSHRQFA